MDGFQKFIPLTKVEERADGSLYVYGTVTAESLDKDGEICHYATTVPFYKAVNEEFAKATEKAGIDKSIMPLREMHQLSAVGCGKDISFDDAEKTIRMGFAVVDSVAADKVRKGVYTGFSQGGQYVRKWERDGKKYYTANPGEVSLVDSPCLAEAHFDYVKADGTHELRKFSPPSSPAAIARLEQTDIDRIAKAVEDSLDKREKEKEIIANDDPGYEDIDKCELPAEVANLKAYSGAMAKASKHQDEFDELVARIESERKKKQDKADNLSSKEKARRTIAEKHYGYKFADTKNKKYGLNSAKEVRSAWSYINMPKNAKLYDSDELSRIKSRIKAAAKEFGVKISEEAEKLLRAIHYMKSSVEGTPLEKGMCEVAQMAQVLETLSWLQRAAVWEREMEGDSSGEPEDLAGLLAHAISAFESMVSEETSELSERAAEASRRGAKAMTNEELAKAAKSAHEHLKELHKLHSEHHEKMHKAHERHRDEMHKAHTEHMEAMHEAHTDHMHKAHEMIEKAAAVLGGEKLDPSGSAREHVDVVRDRKGEGGFGGKATYSREELDSLVKASIAEAVEKAQKDLLQALIDGEKGATAKAAPGVGDRGMVRQMAPPATPAIVTKAAELSGGTATEPTGFTGEDFKKYLAGDPDATAKVLAVTKAGRMTGDQAQRAAELIVVGRSARG